MNLQNMILLTATQGITDTGLISAVSTIAAALCMLPGVAVAIGQGRIATEAVSSVGRQPEAKGEILQTMIVGQGITETAAVYGLLIALVLIFFV